MTQPTPHLGHGVVLVVEDDADMRTLLDELLKNEGYEVVPAKSAADAITFLEEHDAPCAVLVDMLMPGIIGTSLLDYLRHEPRLADVPVVIVSGSPQMAPPGYAVFSKPIDRKALLDFVKARCQRRTGASGP